MEGVFKIGEETKSVVLALELEVRLRMVADRADQRGLLAHMDVAAVGALPDDVPVFSNTCLVSTFLSRAR